MALKDATSGSPRPSNLPPEGLSFWELFDYFWARGLGNAPHPDGTLIPWTATALELAFDGTPDKRSIENWQSQSNMPSPENIRKLSWVIAGDDDHVRRSWYEALIAARLHARRVEQARAKSAPEKHLASLSETAGQSLKTTFNLKWIFGAIAAVGLAGLGWMTWNANALPAITDMRICDTHYFDKEIKDCTQHVSVFVHGVDEVFLSFDFNGVPDGTPFDRWWILNGERVAGRSSFNDDAWPGYTYWRPGVLEVGQYVVRIVVNGEVFTQAFFVQPDGAFSNN